MLLSGIQSDDWQILKVGGWIPAKNVRREA